MSLDHLAELARGVCQDFTLKAGLALAGGAVGEVIAYMLGGVDQHVQILFILMVCDYAFGFARAWATTTVSREKMVRGVWKFLWYFAALVVVHLFDQAFCFQLGQGFINLRGFLALYLSVCETLSALGHLAALGVPLPERLLSRLRAYRDCQVFRDPPAKAAKPAEGVSHG